MDFVIRSTMRVMAGAALCLAVLGCGHPAGSFAQRALDAGPGAVVHISRLEVNGQAGRVFNVKAGTPLRMQAFVEPTTEGISYQWRSSSGSLSAAGATATLQRPEPRYYVITCEVRNARGVGDTQTVHVQVQP